VDVYGYQSGLTPDISDVRVVKHSVLELAFADGLHGEVEVLERMHGQVFEEARSPAGFEKVSVDPESGTVITARFSSHDRPPQSG